MVVACYHLTVMADTINSPEVRCFPALGTDLGWLSIFEGFKDQCHPVRYVRVETVAGRQEPQWDWLISPGILVDAQLPIPIDRYWRFRQTDATRQRTVTFRFNAPQIIGGNPAIQLEIEITTINYIIGGPWSEIHVGNYINQSKRTPKITDACTPISPPSGCTLINRLKWDWWPSCDGTPEPGPELSGVW